MPIYEYRCQTCNDTFEVLTSFAERDSTHVCPMCSAETTNVQVSSFAAVGSSASMLPMAPGPAPSTGGGCCGGGCGCGH